MNAPSRHFLIAIATWRLAGKYPERRGALLFFDRVEGDTPPGPSRRIAKRSEGKLLIPGWTHKIEYLYVDLGSLDDNDPPPPTTISVLGGGRGNGKTGLIAGLALCHLLGPECEPRGEVYSCAYNELLGPHGAWVEWPCTDWMRPSKPYKLSARRLRGFTRR